MKKTLEVVKDYAMITVGIAIVALSVYFFMMPSHVSVGSITGLAIILGNFIKLPISWITMILDVALLIVGFIFLGKEFGVKTVYTSIMMPFLLGVLEKLFPNNTSIMGDPFLDMICYVFIVSVGLTILFHRNASSGGLDIVAKFLNKFMKMELGKAMSLSGIVVAFSSALVYDQKIVVLSVLGTYINGIILDQFIVGYTIKKRVCILSDKIEVFRLFIINELHSGATVYDVIGGYNKEPKQEIVTIVDKSEYLKLMNFIEKTDREAFVTIYDVNKTIYRPKNIQEGIRENQIEAHDI